MGKFVKVLSLLAFILIDANGYVIYSIAQDISMGFENEEVRKNFYVNMGRIQGLKRGTKLSVYRDITKSDPVDAQKRYAHTIKVGTLEVIHTEENSAITVYEGSEKTSDPIVLDGRTPMVGDTVNVDIN